MSRCCNNYCPAVFIANLVLSCSKTSYEVPAFIEKELQGDQLLGRCEVGSRIRVDIDLEGVVVQVDEREGDHLGPNLLKEVLGSGGMGIVFLAWQAAD